MNIFKNNLKRYSHMKLLKSTAYLLLTFLAINANAQLDLSKSEVKIKNESGINTEELEFSPVFYENGLVFITTQYEQGKYGIIDVNTGTNIMSIYRATRNEEGALSNPQPFAKELLSTMHEGSVSFNSTGEVLYFTRNSTKETTVSSGNYRKQLNIYSAQNNGGRWENITEMPFNELGYNTIHPSIAPDMDELYFSSNRPGGYGGYDLYVVKKIGGEWSSPINLGPQVNTPNNEVFPYIHADGTLYFTSDGHGGKGGTDIFLTTKEREVWKKPANLGEPFNSANDDLGFIIDLDKKNGYFSSNRSGGKGKDDIYSFSIQPSKDAGKDELLVNVIDASSSQSIEGAKVTYINLSEVTIGSEDLLISEATEGGTITLKVKPLARDTEFITDDEGKTILNLAKGEYVLRISKDGYLPYQIKIKMPDANRGALLVPLNKALDCIPFTGVVTSGNKRPQAGITVVIRDVVTKQEITVVTDNNGKYESCLKCGKQYDVFALKGNKSSSSVNISTNGQPCSGELALSRDINISSGIVGYGKNADGSDVGSAPITEGTIILLPNIYFNFNDYSLRPDAKSDLDLVAKMLKVYTEMVIEVGSHTDARGGEDYNKKLSERRSQSAVEYLISLGISQERLTAVGYGETRPRNRCVNGVKCSDQLHQENRRTEVRILKIGKLPAEEDADYTPVEQLSEYVEERKSSAPPSYQAPGNEFYNETRPSSSVSEGRFLVIAGTFKNNDNAQNRLKQIQNFGYSSAEIITFDYPASYQMICVNKYNDEQTAKQLVNTLQSLHGISSYVKRAD
jgi:outer membrane protein OmpA-like peptidoglycan-associated protein